MLNHEIKQFDHLPEFDLLDQRAQSFKIAVDHLLSLKKSAFIIETGCMRAWGAASWRGDGRSTAIWDWCRRKNSNIALSIVSIDIDRSAIQRVRKECPEVITINRNSLDFFQSDEACKILPNCMLLYLDSFDWTPELNQASAFHHMAELALVYGLLPKGCMIMVDDCHEEYEGKHWVVAEFMKTIGLRPLYQGYQTIWKKH